MKMESAQRRQSVPIMPAASGQAMPLERLSPREREVLDGIVRGLTNREIGQALGISHRTVEIHRARLMRKLNARSFAGLIAIALGLPPAPRSHNSEGRDRC